MQIFTQFDNPLNIFHAGQHITGRLVVRVQEPTKFQNITMVCKGAAHVSWSEPESSTDSNGKSITETRWFTAHEEYFRYTLMVTGSSAGEVALNPGEHNYTFDFPLPQTIPSSFEGLHGYVRYTVKARINRPGKGPGYDFRIPVTVVCPLDLNFLPALKEPVFDQVSKTFCCCFCRSGPLAMTVELPCSGFVSGQTIPVKVAIQNASSNVIERVNCNLRKRVKYFAQSRTNWEDTVIAHVTAGERIEARGSKIFGRGLRVPPLPPSVLQNCSIINLEYICEVEAVCGALHLNLRAKIPITLGSIPITMGRTKYVAPLPPVAAPGKEASSSFAPSAPMHSDLPPPTYEEAVVPKNRQFGGRLTTFVPRYPVWNFDEQR